MPQSALKSVYSTAPSSPLSRMNGSTETKENENIKMTCRTSVTSVPMKMERLMVDE